MKTLTKEQRGAIATTINIAREVCHEMRDYGCESCPFWSSCQHIDEYMGEHLNNLFQKLLTNK